MKKLGTLKSTEREVYYLSTQTYEWAEHLPSENWLVLPIIDTVDKDLLEKVANICLDRQVSYICTIGEESEYAHDWFDETIIDRKIKNGNSVDTPEDFEDEPMTTWDTDFEEGFWFALTTAFHDKTEINKVVCLNLTKNEHEDRLANLLTEINNGWSPD